MIGRWCIASTDFSALLEFPIVVNEGYEDDPSGSNLILCYSSQRIKIYPADERSADGGVGFGVRRYPPSPGVRDPGCVRSDFGKIEDFPRQPR